MPKFHYEKKSFNIVKCNTDLTENQLEFNVIRGISYVVSNPKDVDTYVKMEFPYPAVSIFDKKIDSRTRTFLKVSIFNLFYDSGTVHLRDYIESYH